MGHRIADHRREVATGRMKYFTLLDRLSDTAPRHPVLRGLDQRPVTRSSATRIQQFLRIERGYRA